MVELSQIPSWTISLLFFIVPLLGLYLFNTIFPTKKPIPARPASPYLPKSYPVVGSALAYLEHLDDLNDWITTILNTSPSLTFTLFRPFGRRQIFTANPANVEHMLKTKFPIYQKGGFFRSTFEDLLGRGIFIVDDSEWKFQRQIASHEFNTKSLRKFIEDVVDTELNNRLIPILSDAATNGTVLDLQDILQRFGTDNICQIAFGYDPECLAPSLPEDRFSIAFDQAVLSLAQRFKTFAPIQWKIKRYLNVGSEKRFKEAYTVAREFARIVVRDKQKDLDTLSDRETDLLSRFLKSGHQDEDFLIDIVISFILAGRDTTSSALTWFFWLLSKNPEVEKNIVSEITKMKDGEKIDSSVFDDVKHMSYIHASLSESMRLHPPVEFDSKQVIADDTLPDGTEAKKGTIVTYVPYAMGRSERLWGEDWAEFKPERWLKREQDDGEWRYFSRDPCTYTVFQAGPRICLGKDMAYLQMKRIVAGILSQFKVVPAVAEDFRPVSIRGTIAKMKGGFPVRLEQRIHSNII